MAALFWMPLWLSQVLPAMSKLPHPFNLNLSSIDLIHQLMWEPGPGTANIVNYSVSVHSVKGISWESVAGCENVQHPLVCNLTAAFSNPRVDYYTKVTAHLGAETSHETTLKPFRPIRDTHLDPPLLTVTSCGRDVCVDLHPPLERLRDIYDSFHYKLQITNNSPNSTPVSKDTKTLNRVIWRHLAQGRKYCVSVKFSDTHVPRHSNYSQPKCTVITGVSPTEPWILMLLFLLLLLCGVLVILVVTGVIPLKRNSLPQVLSSIRHIEERLLFPSSAAFSSLFFSEPTAPSSGIKTTRQAGTDEGDAESLLESTGGSRKGYKLRLGTNVVVAFSSLAPSSLTSPLHREPGLGSNSSSQQNPVFVQSDSSSGSDCRRSHLSLQTGASVDTNTSAMLEEAPTTSALLLQDGQTNSTQGASEPHLSAHTDALNEEEEVVTKGRNQDVNLLTLTFGGHEEEKEHTDTPDVTSPSVSASNISHSTLTATSIPSDATETAVDMGACDIRQQTEEEDDDDEEESSGYMSRAQTHSQQNVV
ncbi:interleukin-10 receptor subunit beta-like [Thalassophryne amazonica]|uniref:interleukin-10 receptor subunit beta-like n=1 Tax=Thalassophryne amazonica TaxID=390379 RepID=UPI001471E5FD|nr:interleukin-10 receptor subunit beta-like [Thalassophryne amazonica]